MAHAPIEPKLPLPKKPAPILPSLPPAQELGSAYRLQQRLIEQFNAAAPTLGKVELAGFRKDWETRLTRLHARLNELRAVVEPVVAGEKEDSPESQQRLARKMAARESTAFDAALVNHSLLVVTIKPAVEVDPLQNFTPPNYNWDTDPNGRFALTDANTITVTGLTRNEDAYVYKDFGAGFFGDFEHLLRAVFTSADARASGTWWCVSNVVDDFEGWLTNSDEALACYWYEKSTGGQRQCHIRNYETGAIDGALGLTYGANYYPKIIRSGATLTCVLYTNAARTSVFDTFSVAVTAARTYRYVFAVNSRNLGSATAISFISADLDLQEAATGIVILRRRLEGY